MNHRLQPNDIVMVEKERKESDMTKPLQNTYLAQLEGGKIRDKYKRMIIARIERLRDTADKIIDQTAVLANKS